ncbi:conserved exported hypothetical protein [Verrucomicrobia bacterium]|nr:conserved exported hypothetical protein [Verrucomicrobiota bacterium]
MKKIIIGVLIALALLIVVLVLAVSFFLDGAVKRGVETAGPMLTKVQVKLDSASLSLLSGSGKLKGLFVGNPEGYKTSSAIEVGTASLSLKPSSVFSDKVIIHSIRLEAPQVTYETDFKGNNLSKILANLDAATGGSSGQPAQPQPAKASKKLQVDDFLITGGMVRASITALNQPVTVPLPEIHLTDLGQGPDGITAAELAKVVVQAIEKNAAQAATSALAGLQKQGLQGLTGLTNATELDSISKGVGGLFKKK